MHTLICLNARAECTMKFYSYRIISFEDITEPRSHGKKFRMKAEVIPTEKRETLEEETETIQIEGTVDFGESYPIYGWPVLFKREKLRKDINQENLRKVMYEYARKYLEKKVQEGETKLSFELKITYQNAPKVCPFDPAKIEIDHNKWYELEVSRPIGF